mgnify:CR=1 FL=1
MDLNAYLVVGALLFTLGIAGVLLRRNVLVMLMSVELMLNGANLTLAAFSRFLNDQAGNALVVFSLTIAAAEVAVGLAPADALALVVYALAARQPDQGKEYKCDEHDQGPARQADTDKTALDRGTAGITP